MLYSVLHTDSNSVFFNMHVLNSKTKPKYFQHCSCTFFESNILWDLQNICIFLDTHTKEIVESHGIEGSYFAGQSHNCSGVVSDFLLQSDSLSMFFAYLELMINSKSIL